MTEIDMSKIKKALKVFWKILNGEDYIRRSSVWMEEVPGLIHPDGSGSATREEIYYGKPFEISSKEDDQEDALVQLIEKGRSPCPFYGLSLIDRYFMEGSNNQCGRLDPFTSCCTDCYLEREGKASCWKTCKYNTETIEEIKTKFQLARVCLNEFGDKWISFKLWMEYFRNNYEIE